MNVQAGFTGGWISPLPGPSLDIFGRGLTAFPRIAKKRAFNNASLHSLHVPNGEDNPPSLAETHLATHDSLPKPCYLGPQNRMAAQATQWFAHRYYPRGGVSQRASLSAQ